jgi:muconolactone delta-isomerase
VLRELSDLASSGGVTPHPAVVGTWSEPELGAGRALELWRAADAAVMQAILRLLPLGFWMTVKTTPLSAHPSGSGAC